MARRNLHIGAAAARLVEALRRGRWNDGQRAAEVIAASLERDGDAVAAAEVRAALADGPQRMVALPHGRGAAPGDWYEVGAPCEEPILGDRLDQDYRRLLRELENTSHFVAAGVDAPTRLLFHGPSGTGKTMAARWLARHLGLPILVARIEAVVDSHLGETAKKLAALFAELDAAPAVLFLDEVESMVGPRGTGEGASAAEMGRSTSALLQLLDKAPQAQIVVAATNFDGGLDGALYRRFPTRLLFDTPTAPAREAMLRRWWSRVEHTEAALALLVASTDGTSAADLRAAAMAHARWAIVERRAIDEGRIGAGPVAP